METESNNGFKSKSGNKRRFLIGKAKRRSEKSRITHDEISQAIRTFKAQGGLIDKLPPEREDVRAKVGNHYAAAFESVIEY